MKIGIVGLPNVGKSALFGALTGVAVPSENYPFCTIDPNVSVVEVPDKRLDRLVEIYKPKKITRAIIEFVDIAGLVRGASKGEGLGNKFLANIRETDAIAHVIRCFRGEKIIHVDGKVDPRSDIATVNLELILADIETVSTRIERIKKMLKSDKKYETELVFLKKLMSHLENEKPARLFATSEKEVVIMAQMCLLTAKPVVYVANVDENAFADIENDENYKTVKEIAKKENSVCIPICAEFESQISSMNKIEKVEFLNEIGLKESGLARFIGVCYTLLGRISFLTAGEPEVRAWTIKNGTKAPEAAGKIHSDIKRGFICAEVVKFDVLASLGSIAAVREHGSLALEGKNYVMKDGDVVNFRFNV